MAGGKKPRHIHLTQPPHTHMAPSPADTHRSFPAPNQGLMHPMDVVMGWLWAIRPAHPLPISPASCHCSDRAGSGPGAPWGAPATPSPLPLPRNALHDPLERHCLIEGGKGASAKLQLL